MRIAAFTAARKTSATFLLRDESLEESANLRSGREHKCTLGNKWGQAGFFKRDNASLDIISLRDESLKESDNFPGPDVLVQDIVEHLEAGLEQFREIAAQEVVARMLELTKIKNGDVLGKNRVRHRH